MKYQSRCTMKRMVFFAAFLINASPAAQPTDTEKEEFMPPVGEGKTWKLTWSDEFNGTKLDKSK